MGPNMGEFGLSHAVTTECCTALNETAQRVVSFAEDRDVVDTALCELMADGQTQCWQAAATTYDQLVAVEGLTGLGFPAIYENIRSVCVDFHNGIIVDNARSITKSSITKSMSY